MSKFSIDDAAAEPNRDMPRTTTKPQETSNSSGNAPGNNSSRSLSANGRQEAPSGAKRRGKTETSEPRKSQATFSVAADDWAKTIPSPGHYAATVVNAWISPRSGVVYLNIEYTILGDDGRRLIVTDFLVLDASPQDRQYTRSAEGKARVKAILEANNRPLQFTSIQAVPLALIGCQVTIAIGHRYIDGLAIPKVQGIVGPAEPDKVEP